MVSRHLAGSRRTLAIAVLARHLLAASVLSATAGAQSMPDPDDLKQYKKALEPGAAIERRIEAMKNVAYYDSWPMAKLLVETLTATLKGIEELEAERADNDAKISRILAKQIEKGGGAIPDYSGVDTLQAIQSRLGREITVEEHAVRGLVAAIGSMKSAESLDFLMKLEPKKPARLRVTLLEAMGLIHDARIAEFLIGEIGDEDFHARVAAARALLRQDPEFVPAEALAPLLRSEDWQERSLGVDALAKIGGREALELLVVQTTKEDGKMLADLCGRLEQLTGQKFGKTPHAWVDWWQKSRDGFEGRGIDISQPAQVVKTDGKYASFFQVKFDSLRVVYVIDISGSMLAAVDDFENLAPDPGKSRIELARREVKASIQGLPPESSFNVIAYSDVVIPWQDRNVPASPKNKKEVFDWLDGLTAAGQTNIFDALDTAFHLAPKSTKDKYYETTGDTILFMSDGGPTCGRTTDCEEILRQVQEWNGTRRITIHTVGIGKQTVRVFLEKLAKQSGGQFVSIEK
jgi:hypothetical protein